MVQLKSDIILKIGYYMFMKSLFCGLLCALMPLVAAVAKTGEYSVIKKYDKVTSINYRELPEPKIWYLDVRGDLSFLSWKNKYTYNMESSSDDFNFKSVFGADIAIGCKLNDFARADLELGYIGNYSEQETEYITEYITEKTDFDLSTFYTTLNGYYDFPSGLYVGVGAGLAMVETSLNHSALVKVSKTNISPMGAVMLGWTHSLNEVLDLNIRYRFAAFSGSTLDDIGVKTKIGLITDNTVSVGLYYEF